MGCSGFYPCTLALIETFTATSVIRQRMWRTFIPSWRSLSFKSRPRWCHSRDDRSEIPYFSALDVVVSCLIAKKQTHPGWALNMWRLLKAPRRTPCFDISLYFSLYFSSLQLMAVGAVTAQAWRCFAPSSHRLVSRTPAHTCMRVRTHLNTQNV